MDAPFRGPRIGDNLTDEDYRRAHAEMNRIYFRAERERRDLTAAEYRRLNEMCNIGSLSYGQRRDVGGRPR